VLQNDLDFREYVVAYTNAANIIDDEFRDTEDLDGLFSGFDPETGHYDPLSWHYEPPEDMTADDAETKRELDKDEKESARETSADSHKESHQMARSESHGSGGAPLLWKGRRDETLQDPRCVFQILKRHFSRYTPEMVSEVCGIAPERVAEVAEAMAANSGRERTSALCYAVGWTQHSTGAQMIRAAAILQTLLGNIGRPGGGIMALRGHASIQGSTDIPTLFNILPGYLPMPQAASHHDLDSWVEADEGKAGFWGNVRAYAVSLMRSYWGDAATEDNDFCFDYLPRITGDHSTYNTVKAMIEGRCKGYFLVGENPAVGSSNG
jgi:formate dehydrogenase major subunit